MAHNKPILPKNMNTPLPPKRRSNVPLYLLGAALALIVVGVLVLSRQAPTTAGKTVLVAGQPKLSVDREQIDFGKVPLDKPVRADFQLSNVGDQPLQILGIPTVEVKEGCWPPKAVVSSTTLQPGQSTLLSMEFMMHAGMEGPHDFRVKVRTNDPDQPIKELVVLSNWAN